MGMFKGFCLGVLTTVLTGLIVGALVVVSGLVDVAAAPSNALADKVLGYASTRSLAHHARPERNPLAGDAAAVRRGLVAYRTLCLACHGGPGATSLELAAGLHPSPPDLASPAVQAFSDGMLYRAIAGGIGSTGMPAFEQGRSPEELWSLVAFVRQLPALSPAQKQELAGPPPAEAPAPAPTKATAAAAGNAHRVAITGFKFDPPELTVRVGETIEWVNADFVAHTATADDQGFDTGTIAPGASARVTVKTKGTVPYFCRFHSAMKGLLKVDGP